MEHKHIVAFYGSTVWTLDLQSDINCLPERSLLGAFGKQHDDYDHDVFNSAGSTLATPHFGPENGVHLSDVYASLCKKGAYPLFSAQQRS